MLKMHRTLSFRCLERLRIGIRHKQTVDRCQHQVRPSNELVSKLTKPKEEVSPLSSTHAEGLLETLESAEPKIETYGKFGAVKSTKGEECWNAFYNSYSKKNLSVRDFFKLVRGVYSEAQYKKYQESPSAVYTVSCCGVLPIASIGLLSLVSGGAFPGLAYIQLTYSASILSFLGGVAWGNSITKENVSFEKLSWAVIPPVLAWSAIMLPLPLGFAVTSSGLITSMIHDVLLTSYPQWFKSLRYILTVITLISFLPTFFFTALRF